MLREQRNTNPGHARKLFTTITIAGVVAAALLAGCSTAQEREKARKNEAADTAKIVVKPDDAFILSAWMSTMTELEAGKLAQERAADPAVRGFASRMIDEHGRSHDTLKALAAKRALGLPNDMDPTHMGWVSELRGLRGGDFDRRYMATMVRDHSEGLDEIQRELTQGTDANVKAYAQQYQAMLREHLAQAKEIASAVGTR